MKEKTKKLMIGGIIVAVLILSIVFIWIFKVGKKETDSEKFAKEYTQITSENPFVYRNIEEIINILEKGTGIVYLGFPVCKWCQRYVKYLTEAANENSVTKIFYYNIQKDRQNNTEEYQKIVSILENYLTNDEEGNKRIYVPSVIALNKGEIVGFDDETASDTHGFSEPDEYWTEEEVKDLKEKLEQMILDSESNICTSCE